MDPRKKVIVGAIVGVIVVVSIIIIITVSVTGSGGLQDCSKDDFREVAFPLKGTDSGKAEPEKAYLKVKFVRKGLAEGAFTMKEAKKACGDLGAEMWEVADRAEWEAVMGSNNLDPAGKEAFWLSAEVKEVCPPGPAAQCKEDAAMLGGGLKVRWPKTGLESVYSRMVGGPDQPCVYVEKAGNSRAGQEAKRLWRKVACEAMYVAACVKRDCKVPAVQASNP